ncbi:MAG: hypothetical protein AUJ74_00525 [Candidatus Omnitrophica bacterium CG1_02_44_16]|nr:MAG: hypothetical protein AUJ74_00525 [Candidatus Omnitrophica bacterium CG1_02_44_16]
MNDKTNFLKISLPIAMITFLCFMPVALFAQVQPQQSDKNENREAIKDKIVKDLGLTEEQQAKFSEHHKNTAAKHKELRRAVRESEKQLREELAKYDADQGKIQAVAATVKKAQAELIDNRITDITALKSILTKEQFEKLQQKAKTRAETMKAKRGDLKESFMKHKQSMEQEENQ